MVVDECPGSNAEIAEECPGDYIFRNSSVIWIFKCNFLVFQLYPNFQLYPISALSNFYPICK